MWSKKTVTHLQQRSASNQGSAKGREPLKLQAGAKNTNGRLDEGAATLLLGDDLLLAPPPPLGHVLEQQSQQPRGDRGGVAQEVRADQRAQNRRNRLEP